MVDPKAGVLPTQSTCLARWDKSLQYAKWLLVDFQVDLDPGQTKEVFLEYGDDLEVPQPSQVVRVSQRKSRMLIDSGALRLEIRRGP